MLGLGFPEQKISRSLYKIRDDSPDSVIVTQESNFSLFSSASGSVERCSFGSDVHDQESLVSELYKHLAGRDLHDSSCCPDLDVPRVSVQNKSNPIKNGEKAQGKEAEVEEDDSLVQDPSKHSFSHTLKECQNRRFRSEAISVDGKKHSRPASLDLNSRGTDAVNSSPRFGGMKKTTSVSSRRSGAFPSPGTPNYRQSDVGVQKGWSSERVPLPANCTRRYVNATPLPFNNVRTLPSKWEDAEKWIFSPVTGDGNRPSTLPPPQRRPKSKSGPLGPPGMALSSSPSMMHVFDGGRVGNFMASSPFSAGVLGADRLTGRGFCADGGGGGSNAAAEPSIARSVSVHGWSDLLTQASLPSSQDEKVDGTKDAGTMISPAVSRRDMATQMSPEGSNCSSPKGRASLSSSSNLVLPIEEVQSHHSSRLQIRDVQVDDRVTVTRWSKKHGSRMLDKGSANCGEWKKKAMEPRASGWEVTEAAKSISKFKREEAKITAWENLQKAKAEAEIRKLEMKLEKIRTSSMDKIMNKLRSAQRKAQDMRSSVAASQANQLTKTSDKIVSFRKPRQINSLSGCFTCHAF